MQPGRLSSADQSALAFEGPETPMHVVALVRLDASSPLASDRDAAVREIRRRFAERLDRAPRLRQVVRGGSGLLGRATWVEANSFDITAHVVSAVLASPGTERQLLELGARFFMEPLDRSRPLWQARVVFGLADGRVAVMVKIHHAITDGPAAVRLLSAVFDVTPELSPSTSRSSSSQVRPPRGRAASTLAAVRGYASALASLSHAPVTSINRPVGLGRNLAVVRLSLAEMKRVAHATGATVNDLFVALAAIGAREMLARHGETVKGGIIVAGVFVGLRMDRAELGNETGVMAVPLPFGERDPLRLLALVAAATAAAKARQPAGGMAALSYLVTRSGLGRVLYRHQRQVNIFTTNVAGPATPLSLLGAAVQDIVAVTSLGGNVGLSFAALSYAGQLNITIIGDSVACPEVDAAADAMRTTWEGLRSGEAATSGA